MLYEMAMPLVEQVEALEFISPAGGRMRTRG